MIVRQKSNVIIYIVFLSLIMQLACFCVPWIGEGIGDRKANELLYSLKGFNPPEKKIVVTVTARNVKDWYDRNLGSIFGQKYSNYRVIYVDDCSTDGTPQLVENFIRIRNQQHRVTLIKNKEWLSQLANHYLISHMCDDNEIIVNVDSDDWLKHDYVLSLINKIYSLNSNVWVTCGGSQFYPNGQIIHNFFTPEIIQANTYRETRWSNWAWWHPRTYYAWLFKQIKLQDLLLNSSFKPLTPSPDSAFMYPILEMAGYHTYQIKDILYRWNWQNPLSQWVISGSNKQREIDALVASWQKYRPLVSPLPSPAIMYSNRKADLIILNTPKAMLENNLATIIRKIKGINKIYIVYEDAADQDQQFYINLKHKFSQVESVYTRNNIQRTLMHVLNNALEHVIFIDKIHVFTHERDIGMCIRELERAFAVGFYLGITQDRIKLNKYIVQYAPLVGNIAAWQFKDGNGEGAHMFSFNWVMYRKKDIIEKLKFIECLRYQDLERKFLSLNNNKNLIGRSIGLYFYS